MQEWKASEKEAQKMTHDGAISVNLVTGEATYISDRPPEQDYSPNHEAAGTAGRVMDEAAGHVERCQAKKARRKRRDTFREGEAARDRPSSRLQFTEEERAAPELKKAIRKSDKAADKLDAAKAAVPVKPPGKEHGSPLSRPVQELKSTIHGEVSKVEGENSGVQAGHLGERQIEKAVSYGGRRIHQARADRKLKPWRDVKRAEQAAVKANADFYWQKSVMENPQLVSSNPISRLWQKKRLQKQYAAAHRAGTGAAQAAGKAAGTTASAAKKGGGTVAQKLGGFVTKNKHTLLIVGGIGLMLMLIMGLMQSCTSMFGGSTSGLVGSSYLSEDADLTGAEAAYCEMEAELQEYLNTYESTHDYDEYHFDLDEIEHDPYVLLSILSALHEGVFTLDEVQGDLEMLFEKQYILTETVTTETRYRTETRTDSEGNPYTVRVPYTWYICTVTLENFDLSHVPVYIMGEDQLSMYALYMSTLGNRPDLFPSSGYVGKYVENPPTAWDIPTEYLTDERFATLITEAEKYLGYPYVWGGSSPETSFDCSGFVSYVLTSTGLCNTGRLGAQGLYNISTPVSDPQPGDLVFFVGTYDTSGISHVGIYVGDNMMLHCGDPISYTNLNTSYWQSHFYAYTWRGGTVADILSKQEYMGHTVNFRTYKESYKDKRVKMTPKEDLVIFENTQEAIIDKETWERVQTLRKTIRRTDSIGKANPLTGLMFCADCGAKMYNHRGKAGNARDWAGRPNGKKRPDRDEYNCSRYDLGNQHYDKYCTTHLIRTAVVNELLLEAIKGVCDYALNNEAEFMAQVCSASEDRQEKAARAIRQRKQRNEKRTDELTRLIRKLYEDNVSGRLSDTLFEQMLRDFEAELSDLTEIISQDQQELERISRETINAEKFLSLVRKYTDFSELTPAMINEFVEKILVHQAQGKGASRTQEIEIFFNFVGKVDIPHKAVELTDEEKAALAEQERRRAKKAEYNRRYMEKKRRQWKEQQEQEQAKQLPPAAEQKGEHIA